MVIWDRNKAIDIEDWSICGGGQLERFDYMHLCISVYNVNTINIYIYIHVYKCTYVYINMHLFHEYVFLNQLQ